MRQMRRGEMKHRVHPRDRLPLQVGHSGLCTIAVKQIGIIHIFKTEMVVATLAGVFHRPLCHEGTYQILFLQKHFAERFE